MISSSTASLATLTIDKLMRPAWRGGGILFDLAVRRLIDRESSRTDLFFCRDPLAADRAASRRVPFAFEAHVPPQNRRTAALYRRFLGAPSCRGLVVISQALKASLEASGLAPAEAPVIVAPDAAAPWRPEPAGPGCPAAGLRTGRGARRLRRAAPPRQGSRADRPTRHRRARGFLPRRRRRRRKTRDRCAPPVCRRIWLCTAS